MLVSRTDSAASFTTNPETAATNSHNYRWHCIWQAATHLAQTARATAGRFQLSFNCRLAAVLPRHCAQEAGAVMFLPLNASKAGRMFDKQVLDP